MKSYVPYRDETDNEKGESRGQGLSCCTVMADDVCCDDRHDCEHDARCGMEKALHPVVRPHHKDHIHAIVFHRMCKHRGVKSMERMAHYMGVKIVGAGW